jgi:regulator of sirC expression with transglutaminase-like and TPR domain
LNVPFAAATLAFGVWTGLALAVDPCADPALSSKAGQAQSLVQAKKFAQAEPIARSVVTACNTQPTGVAALGSALVNQRKFDDAIAAMSASIAAKPDLAYAYFWRGQAYSQKKMPDKLVLDFNTFLRLAPNAPEAPTVRQVLASLK